MLHSIWRVQVSSTKKNQTTRCSFINSYLITELPAPTPAATPTDAAAPPPAATAAATPSPTDPLPRPEPAAIPASHNPAQPAADLCPLSRLYLLLHLWTTAALPAAPAQPVTGPQPSFASHPTHVFTGESINCTNPTLWDSDSLDNLHLNSHELFCVLFVFSS